MTDQNNNDPIEEFFRAKAQEYNVEYHEKDWLKLESRLDKADREYANRKRRRLAAAVVAILISLLAYITYQQHLKINKLSERLSSTENLVDVPEDVYPNNVLPPESTDANKDDEVGSDDIPTANTNRSTVNANDVTTPATSNTTNSNLTTNSRKEEARQFVISTTLEQNKVVLNIAEASSGEFDHRPSDISKTRSSRSKPMHPAVGNTSRNQLSTSTLPPPSNTDRDHQTITIGLLAGPDLSTAGGISNFDSPGYKFGISVEYYISPNFSISAGAIRSSVRYTAQGSEYQLISSSYNTSPAKTKAECVFVDIPISMKYTFAHFNDSRLFATAGLSSYIMLDEEYQFNYANNQSPGLPQQLNQRTGNSHWMSNATVSVGYEVDLMKSISVRAEPFLKLPIKGVGLGNVNLYSMGSLVSMHYSIK